VGIAADAREDGHATEPQPLIYACGYLRYWADSDFLIRTHDPAALAVAVREAVRAIEPGRPVYSVQPLRDALSDALSQARFRTVLVGLFSMMALVLAAVGLYGVIAYLVSQRAREIGIRMALGARPFRIVAEIVRSGGVLAGAGAVGGVVLAVAASKLLSTLLYGIRASDMTAYVSAVGVLLGVALLACLIPGRRAASIDPAQVLRS
jgi:ABC-type antimicrobial peptide transport system permease subunit